ncbi:hypothetical protein B0H15DRAFT_858420 [Mycena belliarum]|uniref:Uncharacterized protein n=1 Tax=Mycena belliarum TaxID=1033014 RepID=A0AAD6TW27_9AGAR|nr:hypothetical protein B0H15DRAFT_858420 [Mycena belliae]
MVGWVPPYKGTHMYMARVDPHLIFGREVCLDVFPSRLSDLTTIQHEYLRMLLGVHSRCVLSALFTETGVVPLSY